LEEPFEGLFQTAVSVIVMSFIFVLCDSNSEFVALIEVDIRVCILTIIIFEILYNQKFCHFNELLGAGSLSDLSKTSAQCTLS
jgi:hypothetical protein